MLVGQLSIPLGTENYQWMVLIRQHLIQENLWKTIEVTGSDTIDSDENHKSSALTRIFFSVGRTLLLNIERKTSPKEAWCILKQLYGGAGPNKLVSLLHKLVSMKIEHFHSCDEYIIKVVQAAYDLQYTDFGVLRDPVHPRAIKFVHFLLMSN